MVGLRREPKPRGRRPKSKKMTNLKRTSIKENCRYDVWGRQNNSSLAPFFFFSLLTSQPNARKNGMIKSERVWASLYAEFL
ncbi:hypothetical protein BGP_6013 [Beggiatoa sp. PS]|nr:hypothetical protein BGP_6013 [Beggiatoa sp. PS]